MPFFDTSVTEMGSGMVFMATQELEFLGNCELKNLNLNEWGNEIPQITLPFKQGSMCVILALTFTLGGWKGVRRNRRYKSLVIGLNLIPEDEIWWETGNPPWTGL